MSFFGFGDDSDGGGFWGSAHDACVDASDEVGTATNAMYDFIGLNAGLGPLADDVGDVVGGFVQDNWANVCDLPTNLSNDFGFSDSGDSGDSAE